MEKLPLEITSKILSQLPLRLRLQCREVCTTWQALVPKLTRMGLLYGVSIDKEGETEAEFYFSGQNHENNTKLDHRLIMPSSSDSEIFMVGSCNGVVCYAGYADSNSCERILYIFNPITGEQIQLPAISKFWGRYSEKAIGFGCNSSRSEYKVVRILVKSYEDGIVRDGFFQVYSLQGATNWTAIGAQNPYLGDLSSLGVCAGGALHWMKQDSTNQMILAFDLACETYKFLPAVPTVSSDTKNVKQLIELEGNLCVLEVSLSKHLTVWELRNYKQKRRRSLSPWVKGKWVSPNWVTKFSIALEENSLFEPSVLTKSVDECLLLYNAVLSCYDPETKTLRKPDETLKKLMDGCTPSVYSTSRATPHTNSLVSLKAIMEKGRGKKRKQLIATQ